MHLAKRGRKLDNLVTDLKDGMSFDSFKTPLSVRLNANPTLLIARCAFALFAFRHLGRACPQARRCPQVRFDFATSISVSNCRFLTLCSTSCRMKVQSIENINTALRFIEEHGVKLAGTGATEVRNLGACVGVCKGHTIGEMSKRHFGFFFKESLNFPI